MMTELHSDVITPQQANTLHGLFIERARRSPDKVAYRHFLHHEWRDLTWGEMLKEVSRWQAALTGLGLQRGDRVAIMLRNCPIWMMFDQAAMSLGLVVIPLYTIDRPENVAYILNDAGVKVLLFENADQWRALRTVRAHLVGVASFVSVYTFKDQDEPRLKAMAEFLPVTAQYQPFPSPDTRQLATIIYTSGTTGKPKGVMLSHENILINAHTCLDSFLVTENDTFLSFLPLSHSLEHTIGYYLPMMAGAKVAFARSVTHLFEDLKSIRPTILVSVPRIYERVHGVLQSRLKQDSVLKSALFDLSADIGWDRFLHQQGRGSWKMSFIIWPVLQKWIAQKVLDYFGGSLRIALSGGAALSPDISKLFIGLGIPLLQGYGLTETSPVISINLPEYNFPDSVGQPIRDVQVKVDERNALLVKGPNVMLGYWNNPEATRAILDEEGWLNTGDVVRISTTGHIFITGRTKEIIVMSNGEKVPPMDMEMSILIDPLFDQVMILGEGQPYLVAIAVLNPTAWQSFARKVGVRHDMPEALTDSRVEGRVLKRIALSLHGFPGYAHVRRVLLLQEPWTIENDQLTPTLKLKRDDLRKQYESQIAKFYTEG